MLNGSVAVITGATRGIGFATAKLFLENNAKVVIFGSKEESVNKALDKLSEYKDNILGMYPNLNSENEVADAFKKLWISLAKLTF